MSTRSSLSDEVADEAAHLSVDGSDGKVSFEIGVEEAMPERKFSRTRLLTVGCTVWGMQLVWCTVFARGTAHLLSIGIPNPATPLLWIAGPICGMIVQPIVGAMSDNIRPRFGHSRRKPFVLVGALATIFSMLGLASIEDIVSLIHPGTGKLSKTLRLVFAFIFVYALNISLQPLQGGIRTMLFESCPKEQQAEVASQYSLIVAVGNVFGYFLGSVQLQELGIPIISRMTQFQALCFTISLLLLIVTAVTCIYAKEDSITKQQNSFRSSRPPANSGRSILMTAVWENIMCLRSLPDYVSLVFQAQFFAWLGWFPVIYYQTSYLAALFICSAPMGTSSIYGSLAAEAMQRASFATLIFAFVALITAIMLYVLVSSKTTQLPFGIKIADHSTLLVTLWLFSHLLFVACMCVTIFTETIVEGTILISVIGISWTLTNMVPFAIIGKEVAKSSQAGTLTSLHNAAISSPQILAAVMCALLFLVAKHTGTRNDITWTMWMAGIAAMGAAWKTIRLRSLLAHEM
ncbi:hypothetical protein F5884DRAFT_748665 [Xylogone sp. PMI_703]|nr:hypothetical protein F5884DRAFT_748665 [Xylogone sp. PMI_703]